MAGGPSGHAEQLNELARLRTRLKALCQDLEKTEGLDPANDQLELLTCVVGAQPVAFALALVERVALAAELLPTPNSPPWAPGLLTVEGRTIPVVDVLARFRNSARDLEPSDVFVIARVWDEPLALVVQETAGVCSVPRSELQPPGEMAEIAPYVIGTVPVQDRTGLLLSISALAGPIAAASP